MRRTRPHVVGGLKHPTSTAHQIGLGAISDNHARTATAVTGQGGHFDWVRIYPQPATTCTAAQISSAISPYAAAGYKNYASFKSSFSWENVASGSDDSRWTSIGTMLNGITPAGAWCFNHEPENDRATFGSAANGAAFAAAFNHVYSVIKPLAPNWLGSPCFTEIGFPSYYTALPGAWDPTVDMNNWIPSSLDLLGVDYYAWRGASDSGSHWATNSFVHDHDGAFSDFLTYASARGVPLCLPEFGYAIRDPAGSFPNDNVNQAAWFQDIADTWAGDARITAIMYFDLNDNDNPAYPNWAFTDPTQPPVYAPSVAAFANIGD